jgi:hypothetical protein
LVNLGQILFATIFLGGILKGELPQIIMIVAGGASALLFIFVGLLISAKERKTERA